MAILLATVCGFLQARCGLGRGQRGQTMAEYAIVIGVIALIAIVAAALLGGNASTLLSSAAKKV